MKNMGTMVVYRGRAIFSRASLVICCASLGGAPALHAGPEDRACIAPQVFMPLSAEVGGSDVDAGGAPTVALGSYERISPDGRFVLRSYSGGRIGQVTILQLPPFAGSVEKAYATPLSNEAFPVQGSWRYVVDTNGAHYVLRDLLQFGAKARARFRGGMTGFYAAAAELPGPAPDQVLIRSLSWPNASGNDDRAGEGALAARTLTVDTRHDRVVNDSGVRYLCMARAGVDGTAYALPMISVDGTEFAAMPQMPVQGKSTMRVFGFGPDGASCELHTTFVYSSGKTVFGYPPAPGKGADLAYEYRGQIWWYSRAAGQAFNVAPPVPGEVEIASAFPGITRDGRIIYAATRKRCDAQGSHCAQRTGYVIVDPYQNPAIKAWRAGHPSQAAPWPTCVRRQQVLDQRAEFAASHGLN